MAWKYEPDMPPFPHYGPGFWPQPQHQRPQDPLETLKEQKRNIEEMEAFFKGKAKDDGKKKIINISTLDMFLIMLLASPIVGYATCNFYVNMFSQFKTIIR